MSSLVEHDGKIGFPTQMTRATVHNAQAGTDGTPRCASFSISSRIFALA
jgi:hypothetical protein